MARLAILDDDPAVHDLLRSFFGGLGHDVACFENIEALKTYLDHHGKDVELIVAEARASGGGLDVLANLRHHQLDCPLIITSAADVPLDAARAIKDGAFDWLAKPLNVTELDVVCSRALKRTILARVLIDERSARPPAGGFAGLIGQSLRMRELYDLIDRVAVTNSNVMITGESGTGKELVARAIHDRGHRAGGPFVAINCSAIPAELLESELFGYRRGSFTGATDDRAGLFEEAGGGTVFLDEIGDMPPLLQAKLLRAVQERVIKRIGENGERPIDVRIVAATHQDLVSAVRRKEFREDLYFRLCVIKILTPPLRERREDIALIAIHFLRRFAVANAKSITGFTREAMAALLAAQWPGNVRELENTVERAVTLCAAPWIDVGDLSLDAPDPHVANFEHVFSKFPTLRQLEREYIQYVLDSTHGKKEDVAAILGIDRKTLYRKEREFDL